MQLMACSSDFGVISKSVKDNQVECGVCHDVFTAQGDRVPRLLHCGHTVCHQCLTRLPVEHYFILCPFDRQPTQLGPSGVWGLNKNYALVELLDRLHTRGSLRLAWSQNVLEKEKEHCLKCDENEEHVAVLYCVTCCTHLCLECSESTHNTRTLMKHERLPISEKPKEYPKCVYHPMHLVEFACLEEECKFNPLMCYICKDYGRHLKHKHTLLETEAENVRTSVVTAVHQYRKYSEEVSEQARRLTAVIQQVEGSVQYTMDSDGGPRTLHTQGTGEAARHKVQQYFSELHERLKRQEVAALSVVETHVRERLCMLKQHQEDMNTLLAQIHSVCYQCEKTLQQDDSKIILAKNEVNSMIENVKKQQQNFTDVLDHHQLDPTIPITFTKDNRVHIGPKMEMRVVTLGLDESGKTSILFQLKQNEFITTIPTIGFNVETVEYRNLKFTIWDVGGQPKLRPLWKHYYFNTQALIFVVDSANKERLDEAHEELTKLMQEKELKDASLLILANKQDLEGCSTIEELTARFHLFKLCCNRSWHIQACDAHTGSGLFDGLNWLSHQLVSARVS